MKTSTLLPYEVGAIARNKADQLLFDPEQLIQNPSDSARPVCKTSTTKYEIPLPRLGSSLIYSGRTGNPQKPSNLLLPSTAAPGRVCRPSMCHTTLFHHRFSRPWALVNVAGPSPQWERYHTAWSRHSPFTPQQSTRTTRRSTRHSTRRI